MIEKFPDSPYASRAELEISQMRASELIDSGNYASMEALIGEIVAEAFSIDY